MTDTTPLEEKKEPSLEEKGKDFMKEYGVLVEKYGIDFASYPVFVPDGQGGFKIIIQSTPVDVSKHPKKSPFVAES